MGFGGVSGGLRNGEWWDVGGGGFGQIESCRSAAAAPGREPLELLANPSARPWWKEPNVSRLMTQRQLAESQGRNNLKYKDHDIYVRMTVKST